MPQWNSESQIPMLTVTASEIRYSRLSFVQRQEGSLLEILGSDPNS